MGGNFARPKTSTGTDALKSGQVELHALRKAREIGDHQQPLVLELPDERQHLAIAGVEKLQAAPPKSAKLLALLDQPLRPPQQRVGIVELGFDIDRLVVILGIDVYRQIQALRIGARESGIAVGAPLHRACAPHCGRPERCCRPCRSRRRSKERACPEARRAGHSSARCAGDRSPASGARRRRMPRLMRISRSRA